METTRGYRTGVGTMTLAPVAALAAALSVALGSGSGTLPLVVGLAVAFAVVVLEPSARVAAVVAPAACARVVPGDCAAPARQVDPDAAGHVRARAPGLGARLHRLP
jgi:hypothetical protein